MVRVPQLLSVIAIGLTLLGVAVLTFIDDQLSMWQVVSRLNELGAQHQSLASGLFFLIGIFWIGALDQTRRWLEPASFDPWLRFAAMAFAASYLLSMVFPCDVGCTPGGSLSQWLHVTLVWGLYYGPLIFALRCLRRFTGLIRVWSVAVVLAAVILHADLLILGGERSGLWQRFYELAFCLLWWWTLSDLMNDQE